MTAVDATARSAGPDGRPEPTFPGAGFRALWLAVGVSQFGSAVSVVTIPVIAVVSLGAGPQQMGLLSALGMIPSFLVRVPAAAWSDRLPRRVPWLVAVNLAQVAVIGAVPLLWWRGMLGLPALLVVVAAASLLTGISSSLSSPVLVGVVPRAHLVTANGRLSATRGVADIGGPGLGGLLLAVLAAPFVVLVDALSFLLAALLYARVRETPPEPAVPAWEPADEPAPPGGTLALAWALLSRGGIRALVVVSLVNGVVDPVLVLFMVDDLRLPASAIGLLLGLGAVGGISGGLLVGRAMSRWGPGGTRAVGAAVTLASLAVLPFTTRGPSGAVGVVLFELAGSLGGTLLVATVFGQLQGAAPAGRVARVMALAMTFLQVATVLGALGGGLLGGLVGSRATLLVAGGLLAATLVPLLLRWRAGGWTCDDEREIR
ncbi:MFS transporter [Micromonospora mirobrigensis]|uniref:Predicted arabinose efflux permease, MFS family n=1 Tax=Micromonospora mirobrigensis TaxID=262898 RepID=A0A1C4WQ24_9ACTN|nr:MFS transporter [Micromonospora mirobrigensis]SCE98300.1 Predicted arabinose efflux permease, MFS family [Micromonospora mirobrigensis]